MIEIDVSHHESLIKLHSGSNTKTIKLCHPPGTFAITPASKTLIQAIIYNNELLSGIGIDWGSGIGCLAVIAAKTAKIKKVYGLEISKADVDISIKNAFINGISDKTWFMLSDSYSPFSQNDKSTLEALKGDVDFILANPPSSEGDDGFGFRREVLRGAGKFLKKGGKVLLNISFQYGFKRIENLLNEVSGFTYKGVLYSTDWVPFDLRRPNLLKCIELYCQEEERGGHEYTFRIPGKSESELVNARVAFDYFKMTGESPLTKWQTHLYTYEP